MRYFLSLGSNLGDRKKALLKALQALERAGVAILKTSSLYETEPVGEKNQPWFLNLAAEVFATIDPERLLDLIQAIERTLGRNSYRRWGPRPMDIDILLAESKVVKSERLTIPHPRLHQRNFVLWPLEEISPGVIHPLLKMSIKDLKRLSTDHSIVRKLKPLSHPKKDGPEKRKNRL